jgi:hypothetical protein
VFIFFHDLIHLLLMCGEINYRGHGRGFNLSLTLRANHEEGKLPGLRDDLPALLCRDQGNDNRWDYLMYPVQFLLQSNNTTARPRIIYNMMFP